MDNSGRYRFRNCIKLRSRFIFFLFLGFGIFWMVFIFWGLIFRFFVVRRCFTYGIFFWRILYFFLLSFKFFFDVFFRNFCNRLSCVDLFSAMIILFIMISILFRFFIIWFMVFWKIFGVYFILKGSFVNLYRLIGVLKV